MEAASTPECPANTRPGSRRIARAARWIAGLSVVGVPLAAAALFLVLPWLGKRGDLNYIVEGVLSSMLDVPVRIDSIDSEPLGRLTLTRLRSVSAAAESRMRFEAAEISVLYDPFDLLRGTVDEVRFVGPEVFVDLDQDLGGLAFLPRFPQARQGDRESPLALPFTVRRMAIEDGRALVRFEGRDLAIDGLGIVVDDLGSDRGLSYEVSARVLGATVAASGRIEIVRRPDGGLEHRIARSEVSVVGVHASSVLPWMRRRPRQVEDTSEERLVERLDDLVHSAELELFGELEGVWPTRLALRLVTRLDDVTAGDPESIGVERGHLDVVLEAEMVGFLQRLTFRLEALAGGTLAAGPRSRNESGSLHVRGTLEQTPQGGPRLVIETTRAALVGGGEVEVAGSIGSLLDVRGALLDLQLRMSGVRTIRVLEFLPREIFASLPIEITDSHGDVSGEVALSGTLGVPRASGRVEVNAAAVRLPGTANAFETRALVAFDGLTIERASATGRARSLELTLDPFDAVELGRAISLLTPALHSFEGTAALGARLEDARFAADEVRGRLRLSGSLRDASFALGEGIGAFAGVSATAEVGVAIGDDPRRLRVSVRARIRAREALIGDVFARFEDDPIEVDADGEVELAEDHRLRRLRVARFATTTPITGAVEGDLTLARDPSGSEFLLECRLRVLEMPTERAFEAFVRDPYANVSPLLASARLTGRSTLAVDIVGRPQDASVEVELSLRDARLELGDLIVDGLGGVLAYRSRAPEGWSRETTLSFGRLRYGPLEVPPMSLRWRVDARGIELLDEVRFPWLGGEVRIDRFAFRPHDAGGQAVSVRANGQGISLERLTRACDLPAIPGTLDFDFQSLTLREGELRIVGKVVVAAFGGTLTFTDLAIDDVLEPYASLRLGEGRVDGMRLGQLGETFRFGLASGVLRGRIRDLEFTAGRVSSFHLDAETVRTAGVPQYIDRRSIESLRRVLSGAFGAIEETFFSRFYFERFGIDCRLDDGTFWLRGTQSEGGDEYLMYGRWYQFPRVSIINARPDQPYDWSSIVENVRAIYRGEFSLDAEDAR